MGRQERGEITRVVGEREKEEEEKEGASELKVGQMEILGFKWSREGSKEKKGLPPRLLMLC